MDLCHRDNGVNLAGDSVTREVQGSFQLSYIFEGTKSRPFLEELLNRRPSAVVSVL